jgi:hypothetical protein
MSHKIAPNLLDFYADRSGTAAREGGRMDKAVLHQAIKV